MKTVGLFILLAISSFVGFSQDTLYTKEGKTINGKVTEITQTEIKYKSAANPDGPQYVINKSDIVLIQYKNGSKDVFQNSSSTTIDNSNQNNSNANNPVYITPRPRVNVIVAAGPYLTWGRRWGYNRPYNYYSYNYYGHYGHHANYGHYGRRGH